MIGRTRPAEMLPNNELGGQKLESLKIGEQNYDDYIPPGKFVLLQPEKELILTEYKSQMGWDWTGEGNNITAVVHIVYGKFWFN